jgi:hypothetical protein
VYIKVYRAIWDKKFGQTDNNPVPSVLYDVWSIHCSNRKVCLPVIPGEGAVSFRTVWFFPIKLFQEAEGKISTNPSLMEFYLIIFI